MVLGRPRQFKIDDAVYQAMLVFWAKGYEGTTIPDLTEAIGINRPSLYAAFGSKRGLFKLALDRYRSEPASYVNRALAKSTAVEAFAALLTGVIDLVTDPERPGGCLFVCGSLARGADDGETQRKLAERRIEGETDIRLRFERAITEGDLPPDSDPAALAKLAATMLWGLSVQAVNGATREELLRVASIIVDSSRPYFTRAIPGRDV